MIEIYILIPSFFLTLLLINLADLKINDFAKILEDIMRTHGLDIDLPRTEEKPDPTELTKQEKEDFELSMKEFYNSPEWKGLKNK